MFFKKKKS